MKSKNLVIYSSAFFLISLLFLAIITQSAKGILTETRRNALMTTLASRQLDDGSFPSFVYPPNRDKGDAYQTAEALYIAKVLNALDRINTERALNYIVSKQNLTLGNLTLWGWPMKILDENSNASSGLSYGVYLTLRALKLVNALDQINKTAAIDFALSRYNESDGAFHEPLITVGMPNGEVIKYTPTGFPLEFFGGDITYTAYANSNMISTFLGVSILAGLNALDRINTIKTTEWILKCQAGNGGFKPFPESHSHSSFPPWSRFISNPFYVDRYGAGLAYTYAAISALKTLGYFDKETIDVNITKVKEYVLSSQDPYQSRVFKDTTLFIAHPDDKRNTDFLHYTYYAIMTLHSIGSLDKEISSKVVNHLNSLQDSGLRFKDSWPIPDSSSEYYGLFVDFPPLQTTFFSVDILNITSTLQILDQLTPSAFKTWHNLTLLSAGLSALSAIGLLIYNAYKQTRRAFPGAGCNPRKPSSPPKHGRQQ